MLVSRPTKFGAGITLGGDYRDLVSLRETVYTLSSESGSLSEHQLTFTMEFASELSKACEGKRDCWQPDGEAPNYMAVNILWPIFLMQLGMLRSTCAYIPTDRRMQSHLYALEACAGEALTKFDPAVGAMCMRWLANFTMPYQDFLLGFVTHQTKKFLYDAAQGKARFRRLPRLLDEISPFSQAYQEFERTVSKLAHDHGGRRQDMVDFSDWPAFKW